MTSRFGYARAWSKDRDTAAQQAELEVMGCREVRVEMTPGPADKTLPELNEIIGSINEGDTLVVTRARVLGRTTRNVLSAIAAIGDRGAFVEILMPPVSTGGPEGRATMNALRVVLDMERDVLKERQMQGIAEAKGKGVYKGRRPQIDRGLVASLSSSGVRISEIAKKFGCSRTAIYKILAKLPVNEVGLGTKM